jgi:phage terminase large subunit-like protein
MPNLHEGQQTVAQHPARFQILACGRRWGKTRLGSLRCIATALQGGRAWWVAPSYPMASIGWRLIKRLSMQIPGVEKREVDRLLDFPGTGSVQVKSADNPDSLRGEGLDFLVMDECAFIKEAAWSEALRPALSDRQGHALFISTPKGRNWFWRLWQTGQDDLEHGWQSWRFPTAENPYIAGEEIDSARQNLPERIFAQEYLAEFVEDAGSVFRRVMDAATAVAQDSAQEGHEYVMGVDWGKHNDFTVIAVLDTHTNGLVYMDRFNQIDYQVQIGRLRALCEKFRPDTIIAERNAMGEPLIEQLQREGLPVQAFVTTNASKTEAIDALALGFERGDVKILPDSVLIGELQAYEMERLPSGLLRYSAPEGMHDDTVMALALGWHAIAVPKWRDISFLSV